MASDMENNGQISNAENYLQRRYMNTFSRIMPFLERTLTMNSNGNNFFTGQQMSMCDMMCYCCLEGPYIEDQSMFSNYPKLMAMRKRVESHPKISEYLKSRINTDW